MKKESGQTLLNITASFTNDLLRTGFTPIPNLLLEYYRKLGISDTELIILLQLIFFASFKNDTYPSVDKLSECMEATTKEIQTGLAQLIEKGYLTVDKEFCNERKEICSCYSLAPLFQELSCIWAMEKQQKLLASQAILEQDLAQDTGKVFKAFEKEFGRLLSPMEAEKIKSWLDDYDLPFELLMEALQRAVLRGVRNCQYIDRILLEWHKQQINSLEALKQHEAALESRNNRKVIKPKELDKEEDEFAQLYLS